MKKRNTQLSPSERTAWLADLRTVLREPDDGAQRALSLVPDKHRVLGPDLVVPGHELDVVRGYFIHDLGGAERVWNNFVLSVLRNTSILVSMRRVRQLVTAYSGDPEKLEEVVRKALPHITRLQLAPVHGPEGEFISVVHCEDLQAIIDATISPPLHLADFQLRAMRLVLVDALSHGRVGQVVQHIFAWASPRPCGVTPEAHLREINTFVGTLLVEAFRYAYTKQRYGIAAALASAVPHPWSQDISRRTYGRALKLAKEHNQEIDNALAWAVVTMQPCPK